MAPFVNASNALTSTARPRRLGERSGILENQSREDSSQKTDGMPELYPANGPNWFRSQGPWKDRVSLQVREVRAHADEDAEMT